AVGWTFLEHVFYVEGRIPRPLFWNYRICSTIDLPTPQIEFLSFEDHRNVKGLGELALTVIPAALVNALSQALGKRIRAIPYRDGGS
ncbi:MAG: xanthine dehydrogenase family protein molybdopterin-binding subunit, partial [Spirochaetes bacterium]|nr:xanthine dehydrogenase family protein molybdopterin-binding subunit [Spirochaetota bacterium]